VTLGIEAHPVRIETKNKIRRSDCEGADEGDILMIRRFRSGPSALLKTSMVTVLLLGAAAAGAEPGDVRSEPVSRPASEATPDKSPDGFHDLICKPNGTEDGFDCADQPTPATIVPIPSQARGPRPQDQPIIG
jgi:hypothetical protein